MTEAFKINLVILAGLWIFGFLAGRLLKQNAYEERIKSAIADKEYWRAISNNRVISFSHNAPPGVGPSGGSGGNGAPKNE